MKVSSDLQVLIESAKNVPQGSDFLQKIKVVLQEDPTDISRLSLVFKIGVPYENKMLRLINSKFFGFRQTVSHLDQAATYLGVYGIYQITLLCELFQTFGPTSQTDLSREGFWRHSFACALATQELARYMGYPQLREAFMAGALHDIGKLFWDQFLTRDFQRILSRVREKDTLIIEVEQELMNVTHAELGAWLLHHWDVFPIWEGAILHHHNPELHMNQDPLVAMVHVADILVRSLLIGDPGDEKISAIHHGAFELCQLTPAHLEFILKQVDQQVSQVDAFIEIALKS